MTDLTYNKAAGPDSYNGGAGKPGYLDRAPLLSPANRGAVNEVYHTARAASLKIQDKARAQLDRLMDYLTPRSPAYATR